jgi:adenylate cyclase
VRRLARDPGGLKLGGERRTLTILFCDVRNFTPMAERMKGEPERLTHLVNRILTPLSVAVLDQGGTIDKYIGDCVMAFWNAPLDDPDHAPHAVLAGLAMLEAMARLNAEFAAEAPATSTGAEAAPRLAVGVGVNTGVCVVGNMGSDRRFDYSALGDAVNYASRLEGASKLCGVPLLLSAATASEIRGRLDPVLVDRLSVKGRSLPEPVYTVLPGPRLPAEAIARHDALMQDLMAGRRAAGDPQVAAFARLHPPLGRLLDGFARRASGEDAGQVGSADG